MTLNEKAHRLADDMAENAGRLRLGVGTVAGARVIDCGGAVTGGLDAGLWLARVSMAGLAEVRYSLPPVAGLPVPGVWVATDDPVRACLACQYAGMAVKVGDFFGLGSGPMRAVAGREPLFDRIPGREDSRFAVGCLESRRHPTEDVVAHLVGKLPTTVEKLSLLVAPTGSIAGTTAVAARALETALHKLHEIGFDVTQVVSGTGSAPLPPVTPHDLQAVGRTNDAILYGGRVTLWVRADDEQLAALGPKVPASGSADYGAPFAEIYERAGDFYKIDPLLFSPAEVTFVNLSTGRCHAFGRVDEGVLRRSFFGG
jgi:methenyltetrahydromethanopterin cyclohydrolase